MNTQIGAFHVDADAKLRDYITEKTNLLEKLFDRIESCRVILKVDNCKDIQNKVVEMSLLMPGARLFTKDKAESFEEAVQLAINELRKQVERYNSKIRRD